MAGSRDGAGAAAASSSIRGVTVDGNGNARVLDCCDSDDPEPNRNKNSDDEDGAEEGTWLRRRDRREVGAAVIVYDPAAVLHNGCLVTMVSDEQWVVPGFAQQSAPECPMEHREAGAPTPPGPSVWLQVCAWCPLHGLGLPREARIFCPTGL